MGQWEGISKQVFIQSRFKKKKKETPTVLIGDSQVVKNTDTASIETKGFCNYKKTNGIKRHLCVDTLGNILFVACTPF